VRHLNSRFIRVQTNPESRCFASWPSFKGMLANHG
jgi:hypothetical protein